ncbi:MAG: HAMP domain-containing histidine kinase [Chromatiaceae bacterium]|nr:HAMP domain-containing histidine kinase [Chromatiaceae bacterium]
MIRRFFDLSFKHKIPLWSGALIVVSALSVSGALMYRAYQDLQSALITSADALGSTLAQTLVAPLLHDDVWRGFEIVRAPFRNTDIENPVRPEMAFVVNPDLRIFVASDPDRLPMLTELVSAGGEFAQLADAIAPHRIDPMVVIEPEESEFLFVAIPMLDGGARLGTLVLAYSRSALSVMFLRSAIGAALFGLLVLAVLLPVNWYWGHRMALPLIRLTQRMEDIQQNLPEHAEPGLYDYQDELGRLYQAYNRMVEALHEKELLERGIVSAERLAAVGRLTAGIAHEINNPLAGMLTAIDTLKQRGALDERAQRTLGLIERGLLQVRDTVAALLVEARQQKRDLDPQDIEDVRTLLQPIATKCHVRLELNVELPECVPIPAGSVRQVLINLLNNALQAAGEGGWVKGAVVASATKLQIEVANSGEIPADRLGHLFEPFVSFQEGGHGLGLWVTYQLVQQMQGRIEVLCESKTVRFTVTLPIDEAEDEAA